MPTPDQIAAFSLAIGAALFAFAKVAIPLGLAGSLIEVAGKHFALPRVERLGHALKSFFADVPATLLGSKK